MIAAVAIVWVLVSWVRPTLHAGNGLSVNHLGGTNVVQTGYITVGEPGSYSFRITAEEYVRLIVDNQVVIDRSQVGPGAPRNGSTQLSTGSHRMLVEYGQADGQQQPVFDWRPPTHADYGSVPWWVLSQRPASYAGVVVVRVVDSLPPVLTAIVGLAAAWWAYLWFARRRQRWVAWGARYRANSTGLYLLLTVVCIALALGPPYGLWQYVYWLPGLNLIRASSRFMVLGVLGIAILAGIGFDRMSAARAMMTRRLAGAVVGGFLLLEFMVVPFAGGPFEVQIPAADRWLAGKDEPFSVAEVPVTPDVRYHTQYMLHSMAHWQKTIHGYSGFRPRLHDRLYRHLALFPDEESLRELVRFDVTYLVVHLSWFSPEDQRSIEQSLGELDAWLTLEYSDPESRIYSIHEPDEAAPASAAAG